MQSSCMGGSMFACLRKLSVCVQALHTAPCECDAVRASCILHVLRRGLGTHPWCLFCRVGPSIESAADVLRSAATAMLAKLQPSDLPPEVSFFQLRAAPHHDMWHLLLTLKVTTLQGCVLKAEAAHCCRSWKVHGSRCLHGLCMYAWPLSTWALP